MENGMVDELREWGARRDRPILVLQATVLTLIIFMTTVSCATFGNDEREPLFSLPVIGKANQQSPQGDEGQPKARRVQPKISTSLKVAKANSPKAKEAKMPAEVGTQKDQQLYQEFLEWQKRQKGRTDS
jgi:hypothetical protein